MAENLLLFNDLSFYFCRTCFTEEKFFVRFKMASDVQYAGRNSKKSNLGILQYFYVLSSTMRLYFCQQHESNVESNVGMKKLV
jgi:hypothetical protein